MSAARSPRPCSAMPPRSSSCRWARRSASPRCSPARSTCSSRNSTWTFSRDTDLGLDFVAVDYYDGQGFLVRKELGVKSAKELSGATICVQTGTTTEKNLADYFRTNNLELKSVVFETAEQTRGAYDEGRCDAYTTDASGLAAERTHAEESGRQHHPAGDHLQGAARAGRAPRRQPLGRHRPLVVQRHADRRGEGHHPGQRRRHEGEVRGSGGPAPARRRGRDGQDDRACRTTGPTTSSSRSATTARASSATSARRRRSASRAASTNSGARAACSTRRRSAELGRNRKATSGASVLPAESTRPTRFGAIAK